MARKSKPAKSGGNRGTGCGFPEFPRLTLLRFSAPLLSCSLVRWCWSVIWSVGDRVIWLARWSVVRGFRVVQEQSRSQKQPINMSHQIERREVSITLGGETRQTQITRTINDGQPGFWYAELAMVTCAFRSGKKLHSKLAPLVYEGKGGQFTISRVVIANREARAIRWADVTPANSNWKREDRLSKLAP